MDRQENHPHFAPAVPIGLTGLWKRSDLAEINAAQSGFHATGIETEAEGARARRALGTLGVAETCFWSIVIWIPHWRVT
jgi:hypothetical protein